MLMWYICLAYSGGGDGWGNFVLRIHVPLGQHRETFLDVDQEECGLWVRLWV